MNNAKINNLFKEIKEILSKNKLENNDLIYIGYLSDCLKGEAGTQYIQNNLEKDYDEEDICFLREEYEDMVHYLESLITQVIEINTLDDINHAFESDKNLRFGKTIMKWEI